MAHTVARQCVRKACSFRFPGPDRDDFACPKCGSPTKIARPYLEPFHEIRTATGSSVLRLEIGLDNLRSALNVGSVFRTSDGAGVQHIHLFGICPPPTHPEVRKTALGADETIPWSQHWDGVEAIRNFKTEGTIVWSLEKSSQSVDLFSIPNPSENQKMILILGNENSGVDPGILELSDQVVHLPMLGLKESLNVSNAFAIAVYWIRFGRQISAM
jgi:23S rRNA (guanosine2251-2'-O)-methyltransferase